MLKIEFSHLFKNIEQSSQEYKNPLSLGYHANAKALVHIKFVLI